MSDQDPHPERYFIDPGQEPLPGLEEWAPPAARDKDELAPIASSDKVAPAGAPASTSTRVAARANARSRSKAREKQSSRGFQVLEVFLVGLTVTVGILIFAVAILLMRPSGSSNLFVDLNANLRATLGPSYVTAEQAVGSVIGRGRDGYNARVAPIVKRVAGTAGIKIKSSEVVKGKDADLELFLKCRECHTLYTYRSALGGIYIDHNIHGLPWEKEMRRETGVKLADIKKAEATATDIATGAKQADDGEEEEEGGEHAEESGHEEDPVEIAKRLTCKGCHNDVPEGEPESAAHFVPEMTCARCHIDAELHSKDERELQGVLVPEKTCYECHINKNQKDAQVKDAKTCRFCHAPAWYWAESKAGAAFVSEEKTVRFLEGRQVHKKKLDNLTFSRPSLSGEKRKFCARCHVRDSFCNDCHQVVQGSHKNRDWFIKNHGPKIVKEQVWAANQCWECHSGNWCARKCHLNGPKSRGNPNRSTGRYPIPWKNLKDAD